MALKPDSNFTNFTAASADYPLGSSKNDSTGTTGDGTEHNAIRANDVFGFQQAILTAAGITSSETADTALFSQYLQGIIQQIQGRASLYDDGGVADAYLATPRSNQQTANGLFEGQRFKVLIDNTNTGAATLDVSKIEDQSASFGTTVINVKLAGGTVDPDSGQIAVGSEQEFIYRTAPSAHAELVEPVTGIIPNRYDNTTETLVVGDLNKVTVVDLASAQTKTLPPLSVVKSGSLVGFRLNSVTTGLLTLTADAADNFQIQGVSINSIAMSDAGDMLIFHADPTNNVWSLMVDKMYGPHFKAQRTTSQGITSGVTTKLQYNTEVDDTHNCYDNTTNYRFTPTIPGVYKVYIKAYFGDSGPGGCRTQLDLYKNGAFYGNGNRVGFPGAVTDKILEGNFEVYLNGSTDYIEAYCLSLETGTTFGTSLNSEFYATRFK